MKYNWNRHKISFSLYLDVAESLEYNKEDVLNLNTLKEGLL